MKKYIKSGLVMIAAVLFMLQAAETRAATLKYVRTAKHPDFTRIAFEFQRPAQYEEPVINGNGKFTVVFPGSTTVLPREILYKKTPIKPVRSIEFVQKGNLLTAAITLSFPYFKLKTFSLTGPDRVVIDAYAIPSPTRENSPANSLDAKPSEEESKALETKPPKALSKKSSKKELTGRVTQQPTVIPEKPPVKEPDKPEMIEPKLIPVKSLEEESGKPKTTEPKPIRIKSSKKEIGDTLEIKKNTALDIPLKQAKEAYTEGVKKRHVSPKTTQNATVKATEQDQIKPAESRPSIGNNYNLQTYMLALLNFFTIVIILLLSINLIKRKSGIDSEHPEKISESLKTLDESIAAIDTMINRELKKHDES